ncbi:uncharacterized protein LOC119921614 isoform X1 [Tachyglossus aculeatus]|uniref:uncharacterized protein LOC119921614 isoform X1 n=1 Tax=Tachyglossus aculeatus TaxID=9261 RepID=UPI0018F5904B|nr:uncharacterized protein LOC119921614 isoform X1 [Tachyglossus aculeatus]
MLRRRAGPSGAQRVGNTPRSTAGSWNNVTELRDSRHALLPERLKTESREVAREQNIAETEFKASRGSMSCFMRQNNLRLRRRAVLHRRLPEGFPREVLEFQKSLKRRRLEWDYFPSWTGDAADRKTEKVRSFVFILIHSLIRSEDGEGGGPGARTAGRGHGVPGSRGGVVPVTLRRLLMDRFSSPREEAGKSSNGPRASENQCSVWPLGVALFPPRASGNTCSQVSPSPKARAMDGFSERWTGAQSGGRVLGAMDGCSERWTGCRSDGWVLGAMDGFLEW